MTSKATLPLVVLVCEFVVFIQCGVWFEVLYSLLAALDWLLRNQRRSPSRSRLVTPGRLTFGEGVALDLKYLDGERSLEGLAGGDGGQHHGGVGGEAHVDVH